MEYLDQISADNRQAAAKPTGSFFDGFPIPKNLLKWAGIAIGAVILIAIVASLFSGSGSSDLTLIERINLRSTNLSQTIATYNAQIKSSRLRALTNNISSVLTYNQTETLNFLKNNYADEKGNVVFDAALTAEETEYITNVNADLDRAILESSLDRTYHRTIIREVGYLLNLEDSLGARAKDANLITFLNQSVTNLSALYTDIQNFTDPAL